MLIYPNTLRILNTKTNFMKRYISVLYLSGDKAKVNYVPLTPYMDFKERLQNPERLQENLQHRGVAIDIGCVKNKYQAYIDLQRKKHDLEQARDDITRQIRATNVKGNANHVDDLKSKAIAIKAKLKTLKETMYSIDQDFICEFLSLPNELHEKCPTDSTRDESLGEYSKQSNTLSHLARKDLINFIDKDCHYLFDEAAEFEVDVVLMCKEHFHKKNFISTINPDFSRKVIIEASLAEGQYHEVHENDESHQFNTAFLTGGGSFESFLGHLAKLSIYPSILPLRLVGTGRLYKKNQFDTNYGLYAATQTNTVHVLVASGSKDNADQEMESLISNVEDFYKQLGIRFRIKFVSAANLTPAESLRASIQVYSPTFSTYIEVGHISHYLDFISRRILFSSIEKEKKFPHLVGGSILSTSPLIAAAIENRIPLSVARNVNCVSPLEEFKSLFS